MTTLHKTSSLVGSLLCQSMLGLHGVRSMSNTMLSATHLVVNVAGSSATQFKTTFGLNLLIPIVWG
jgi:hypothetical protein